MQIASSPGLRARLKEGTTGEHASVEQFLRLDSPALTLADYHAYLRGMESFLRGLEPQLEASAALRDFGIDMGARAKGGWLRADLDYFGLRRHAVHAEWNGGWDTPASLLGCAYVLEGATLGGRVISPRLLTRWGLEPGRGATFVNGYGARTGPMWKAFVEALDAAPLDEEGAAECVEGAQLTFARLESWFRR